MTRTKFFLFSFFKLPSTFIHELMHSVPVLFFTMTDILFNLVRLLLRIRPKPITKITSFNLIPDYSTGTLGSVSYVNASSIQSIVINLAPLISWALLLLVLEYLEYITIDTSAYSIILLPYSPRIIDLYVLFIALQLLFAGKLSRQDLKNVFVAIFSLDFLLKLIFVVFIMWTIR